MADERPALLRLPDELLEAIVLDIPTPADVAAFGRTCKQAHKVTCEPKLWKRHCLDAWQHWNEDHELAAKQEQPPSQVDWRRLYAVRARGDREVAALLDDLIASQKGRYHRMEQIAARRYDAKDLLLRQKYHTPDDAEDVLARRYWANATLDRLHRGLAVETWMRLPKGQPVELEDALGAFDIFVLSGYKRDPNAVSRKLDDLAKCVESAYAEKASQDADDDKEIPTFEQLTTRQKAIEVARVLRMHRCVGKADSVPYHALQNNFISIALFEGHSSLPLQSAAIYCAVARRLGIEANPSNYPQHVYVVVQAPPDQTLDGEPAAPESAPGRMYMNPWETSEEVPLDLLREGLAHRGVPPGEYASYLGPANAFEMTLRTLRNLGTSLERAQTGMEVGLPGRQGSMRADAEGSAYAMFWAMFILGDAHPVRAASERRRYLGYLLDHFEGEYPQDIGLLDTVAAALLGTGPERQTLAQLVDQARRADQFGKLVHRRGPNAAGVQFRVGQYFRHRHYGYVACIVGWDPHCTASTQWKTTMRVHELSRGERQPFYHVVVFDSTTRYVAEENIKPFTADDYGKGLSDVPPPVSLMQLAGCYFKRWDERSMTFVSNVREEYPDD